MMNFRPKLFLLALLAIAFHLSSQTYVDSLQSGGTWRRCLVFVPSTYDSAAAAPLVFNFHGYGSNQNEQYVYTAMHQVADTAGFILVTPQGSGSSPFWNTGLTSSPDDVDFTDRMIDQLALKYSIDSERIYACGFSNGGIFSIYLGCNMPSRITAVASVGGAMMYFWAAACQPPRPMPVLLIHGTQDNVVPYSGNSNFVPVDSVAAKWRRHNGCSSVQSVQLADLSPGDGCTVVHRVHGDCLNSSNVEVFVVNNGGHTWPGSPFSFPGTTQDISASQEIWKFFRRYHRAQFTQSVDVPEIPRRNSGLWPNPATDRVHFSEATSFRIFTADGTSLLEGEGGSADLSELSPGLYFLQTQGSTRPLILLPK